MNHLSRILLLALIVFSCQKEQRTSDAPFTKVKDDFSSPKSLFVDHVSSFTGGVISVKSDIRLRLNKSVSDSLVGSTLNDIFSFSPKLEGATSWEDNKTIVFRPSSTLTGNTKYKATANLKSIIPTIDKKKEEFNFTFQTLLQNYEATIGGLKLYNKEDLSKIKIEGQVQTADVVNLADVEKMITATQNGSSLNLSWESGETNTFLYTIEDVTRTKESNQVILKIDGQPIGVDKVVDMEVDVPSIDDYKVVSSKIVRGSENYISVSFSDPLDSRQNLNGLVSLTNTQNKPRLVIDLNELKIYPTQDITATATLTINKGIKNIAGYGLKKDYVTQLQFSQIKPAVRLTSEENKAILPNSAGLTLPFEAVGLNAVEVTIIKIFEDNAQQYLQVNNIGGQSQLRRVGRPVAKKIVPLNTSGVTNLNNWNRFTLDLNELLTTEPGAIYKVSIGFRKNHSLYFCADNDQIAQIQDELDEWNQEEEESSYWDSYDNYYNPGYNWNDRDNPCSNSYYGARRNANKMLFASDLGIIAKRRDGGDLSVFVSNLVSTAPQKGVLIDVFDYQQQLIGSSETDQEGKAKIRTTKVPYLLVAKKDDQIGYLKVNDGTALSLSNFDITGTKIQKGLKGFLYGERGVWRPADTIHLGFILQDIEETLPENHPVILELYNPDGQLMQRAISSEGVGKIYRFDFVTDSDAPTGNWRALAKVGGASFSKTVKIETIKPNRLKINLAFDKEKFSANDSRVSGDLNVRWLTGAKAGNLKAEYELLLKPAKTVFEGYPNFSFDDESKEFRSSREMVFEGRVNNEGFTKLNLDLSNTRNAPGALNAMLFGKVYEEGGDFSISNTTIPYYPYKSFVGLKIPEGDKRGILLTDKDHKVRIATVDAEGNPVDRKGIKAKLYKLNWKWWWDNSYESLSNYVSRSYRDPVASGTLNTVNGEGSYDLRIDYPQWGRYYLQVEDPISGHTSGQVVYLDWPGWAGKGKRGGLDGASMLDFGVEKSEYKVGEQIALSIPSTKGNRILVSLETGSEVIQTFWVETEEETTTIAFEATSEMSPNIYAHLTMIQPHGQNANDLPIRLYGVQSIKVVDSETALNPVIESPSVLRPGQPYTIGISEKNGKAMAYTVAIVDEGLLDITNFKTPKPWNNFYAREALGIKTWDVYDDVMGSLSGQNDRLLAIGGDGELKPKEEKEANRFKPVVKFLGPFSLKAGESRKHVVKMSQYIGSVKTMVVAANDNAFGHAEIATPVKQPLMVLATLPRVAGPGESMKLPVNIFALGNNIKDVAISVEASGALTLSGAKYAQLTFDEAGDKVVYFDVKAKDILGMGQIKVTAKSGQTEATYDIEMNVIPRNPITTEVAEKVIANGSSWNFDYSPVGILGENTGHIEISSLPPLNIEKRLGYLIRYPHGCIEQTTSSVFPQLFLSNLLTLSEEKKGEIQRNIEAGIKRLKSFQLSNGGFSYWPGNQYANNWGSNYAGHFLIEAKKAGYAVPESMISNWKSYQTSKAEAWGALSSDDDSDIAQAYRLYTLAIAEAEALGAMNRMSESSDISRTAKWRLASAYASAGYDTQAQELVDGLSTEVTTSKTSNRYTFGSSTRDQAMILETLLRLGQKEKAFELLLKLAKEMGDDSRWMSTQTTAYCFIAIAKYTANFGVENETNVDLNVAGNIQQIEGNDFAYQIALDNADAQNVISITNNGSAPVFARAISTGVPLEGNERLVTRNINFKVAYTDLNGSTIDISKLRQGTNFKAEVKVTNPGLKGDYTELALTNIFPSGWEIINTRLDGSAGSDGNADYVDIRDDRVMHYFDLKPNKSASFTVLLNASYQGTYYLPTVSVEAMYDNSIFANKPGKWVTVEPEK